MLIKLKNKKGQGAASEYVITFFLVVIIVSAMTVYLRRSLQARVRDSYRYMIRSVALGYPRSERLDKYIDGVPVWYEPYYAQVNANRYSNSSETRRGFASPGFSSGIAEKEYDTFVEQKVLSTQAPPKDAD